jgi:hypothetical protein
MKTPARDDWGPSIGLSLRTICNRVRNTSCGYVARDAIIFENAEHTRMVLGDREA